jgi:hypothetical protein
MPTPASKLALEDLRDLTTLEWYVIPLLAITIGSLYSVAIAANVICLGFLGWTY